MNFYNEIDKNAAEWIRNLIKAGEIPNGVVDERSIVEIQPEELVGYTQCHWFCGVAGWSLAMRLAGIPDDFPCWTGSAPCQSFSSAGKQKGQDDERHLWPEMFRLVRERKPPVLFGEQVSAAVRFGWLDGVSQDLESENYAVGSIILGAHSVGSPHIRQRLYWGAVLNEESVRRRAGDVLRSVDWMADSSRTASGIDSRGLPETEAGISGSREQHGGLPVGFGDGGADGRLADANIPLVCGESSAWQQQVDEQDGGTRLVDGVAGRLGDSIDEGLERHGGHVGNGSESRRLDSRANGSVAASGAWSDFRVIACRDGKNRRVGRGVPPLAPGVPRDLVRVRSTLEGMGYGPKEVDRMCRRPRKILSLAGRNRVGRLKGYGNAIVPPLAAEFIRAFMESVAETDV